MAIIEIDNVSFELKNTSFDFGFLHDYGRVFAAFDQNDSGNICFGVEDKGKRYFIKTAGAETLHKPETVKTGDAVLTLVQAADIYKTLRHPSLIDLLEGRETPNGYILIFDWASGECMNEHWTYDKYPKYTHEKSAFYRYIRLRADVLLRSIYELFEFHRFAASKNYAAIDFYDGSVMFDFETHKTTICDIDLYKKRPYINNRGRLWGSSRFMSPEEYAKGGVIDEITNVYTLGAAALVFLGGGTDRGFDKWRMGGNLYDVALKAVSNDREKRYTTINEFMENWNEALLLDKVCFQ
jgi:serine/threonine-protein kinase